MEETTTIDLVRALAVGQLECHSQRLKKMEERAIQLRAELNHTLKMLANESAEVNRYKSIIEHCEGQS